jgi:hypothetical protein
VADAADREAVENATVRRRGLRPLTVVALCCVVAVLAVMVTKLAHPYGATGGTPYAINTETGDPSSSDGSDGTADPTESTDATSATATDPATATAGAANQPGTVPAPAPPAAASPTGQPSPTPAPSPAASATRSPTTLSYEAEASGNTATGTRLFGCGGCSGGKKVGYVGGGTGTLQFNGVTAASTGTVQLTIYFVNGGSGSRTCKLSVNGGGSVTISFSTTRDWSTTAASTLYLPLLGGANKLRFYNSGTAMCPDFDRLTVRS